MSEKVQAVAAVHQITAWSGPLPDPKHLQLYESTCPGAAKSIIEMAADGRRGRQGREGGVLQQDQGRGVTQGPRAAPAAHRLQSACMLQEHLQR